MRFSTHLFQDLSSLAREINHPVVLIHGFGDIPGLSGIWTAVEEVGRYAKVGHPDSIDTTAQNYRRTDEFSYT